MKSECMLNIWIDSFSAIPPEGPVSTDEPFLSICVFSSFEFVNYLPIIEKYKSILR